MLGRPPVSDDARPPLSLCALAALLPDTPLGHEPHQQFVRRLLLPQSAAEEPPVAARCVRPPRWCLARLPVAAVDADCGRSFPKPLEHCERAPRGSLTASAPASLRSAGCDAACCARRRFACALRVEGRRHRRRGGGLGGGGGAAGSCAHQPHGARDGGAAPQGEPRLSRAAVWPGGGAGWPWRTTGRSALCGVAALMPSANSMIRSMIRSDQISLTRAVLPSRNLQPVRRAGHQRAPRRDHAAPAGGEGAPAPAKAVGVGVNVACLQALGGGRLLGVKRVAEERERGRAGSGSCRRAEPRRRSAWHDGRPPGRGPPLACLSGGFAPPRP